MNKAFFIMLKELGGMIRSASRIIMHTRRIALTTSAVGQLTAEPIVAYMSGVYCVVFVNSLQIFWSTTIVCVFMLFLNYT